MLEIKAVFKCSDVDYQLFFIFTGATRHGVSLFSELAKPFPLLIVQYNLITTEVPLLAKKFYMLNKKTNAEEATASDG